MTEWRVEQHDVTQPWPVEDESVQTIVTSPPYWGLRSYLPQDDPLKPQEMGCERTPEEYVSRLVGVMREARRVLRKDGTLWVVIGDSYAGARAEGGGTMAGFNDRYFGRDTDGGKQTVTDTSKPRREAVAGLKPKDLVGIPWRVAFALQADGWWLRSDIIWSKPNPMPESVTDRPTKAHEYVFLLSKSARYYYDAEAIAEKATCDRMRGTQDYSHVPNGGDNSGLSHGTFETRNRRSVWTITPKPFKGAHFATFPPALIEPCIKAGSRPGDLVLDPFAGSGTVVMVALRLGRRGLGFDLSAPYVEMARGRVTADLEKQAATESS